MPQSKQVDTPILENKDVKALLTLLKKNQAQSNKQLAAALNHVASLENQLAVTMDLLKTMQQDLQQVQSHPLKTALQKSIIALQDRILALRNNLTAVKASIIEGCKNALADFKLRGVAALDGLARFFHIRPGLESTLKNINQSIATDEKAIAKIEAVSARYHEAGRHLKNVGRAINGKEAIQETKPAGKLAKSIEASYKSELSCLQSMKKSVEKAIDNMARLEQTAQKRPPSILKSLREHKEQAPPQARKVREATREER